jgi:large subunit ribosomal protein L49
MRLSLPTPFSFSAITSRHSLNPRFFAHNALSSPRSPRHPYFVPRNSRGSLPVYSDVRNGGTRYLISIRNVEGSIKVCDPTLAVTHLSSVLQKALADGLLRDLSNSTSPVPTVVKVRITGSNHLVLSGLRRKQAVLDWLVRHGF